MTILCIAALPRTGTSHLCSLLKAVPELDSRFEIFHPKEAFTVQPGEVERLAGIAGVPFAGANDPRLVAYVRGNPRALLDLLEAQAQQQQRVLSFKVFPPHLAPERVVQDLVLRSGLQFVLLRRWPIDSYISDQKARLVGTWGKAPTSALQVELRAAEFLKWHERATNWYQGLTAALHSAGKRFGQLIYEDDIAPGSAQAVRAVAREARSLGVHLSVPERLDGFGLQRQDESSSYEEKVSNWADFVAEIRARGEEARLEGYIALRRAPRR